MAGTARKMRSLPVPIANPCALAEEYGIRSVAFPNISTGIFDFPKHRAAAIAIETVTHFTARSISKVIFVCYDEENFRIYTDLFAGKRRSK